MAALVPALPREHYVDPEVHERERGAALASAWTCVDRLDRLALTGPGRLAVVEVLGESLLATTGPRDGDGAVRVLANVCRHRGSQVVPHEPGTSPAPCASAALRCPYHSWTYDLAGRLLRAPHTEDVEGFAEAEFGLVEVSSGTWGGYLFVSLDPVESLAVALGGVPERLVRYPLADLAVGASVTYDVRANWKVLAENYNECYHCGPVHPELVRLVPAFGGGGSGLDWDAGVPHRDGAWTFTASGTTHRQPFPALDEQERVRHKGELVHPNLWLSLAADHVASFVLDPLAVDRTRVRFDVLVEPHETAACADALELWDTVNRQDWAVCESVQRGMTSRFYGQGWYAPMEDASLDVGRWLLPRLSPAPTGERQPGRSP